MQYETNKAAMKKCRDMKRNKNKCYKNIIYCRLIKNDK